MPFTASGSPTAGLTAYSLDAPAKQLDPNSAWVSLRTIAHWRSRKKRKAAPAAPQSNGKVTKMTVSYTDVVGALKKSVASAFEAPEAERPALVERAIDDFCDYTGAMANEIRVEAFSDGLRQDFAKFNGLDIEDPLQKGLNDVSGISSLLKSAENVLMSWIDEDGNALSWGESTPPEPLIKAYMDWVDGGKMLLRSIVSTSMPGQIPAAALDAEYGKPVPTEDLAKAHEALKAAVARLTDPKVLAKLGAIMGGERLAKAEGDMPPGGEGGEPAVAEDDPVANMNPIEAMGRLAAGIVMIADQMMGPEADEEDPAAAGAGGEAPPPPAEGAGEKEPPPAEGGGEEAPEKRKPPFEKAAGNGDLAKSFAIMEARLNALEKENGSLKADVVRLGAQPAPARGALRVVGKGEDSALAKASGNDLEELAKALDALPPEERSLRMMKIAQGTPTARIS